MKTVKENDSKKTVEKKNTKNAATDKKSEKETPKAVKKSPAKK